MLTRTAGQQRRRSLERPRPKSEPLTDGTRTWLPRLVLVLTFGAAASVGLSQLTPPSVVPADASATAFSAERAVRHLATIAREPRPVGSPGHAATRAYLLEEIAGMGLTPEVQATTTVSRFAGSSSFDAGSVQNVIARLPGSASTGAIVLNAHYDGGVSGPAAGDCGACVVTLLETMRALRAAPSLRNDVIFVFSDAEEVGDLGAHAFATQHPWMQDVRLALNFESQGAGGPAILYATSGGNRRLVAEFARAAPHALTSSFTAGLIALVPELRLACDLQDYLDQGSAGLGFFFSGNTPAYHTELDNPQVLDPRTVQHTGSYALALTRHFGDLDLAVVEDTRDAVFFNLARGWVVHHSAAWSLPLAVMGLVLSLGLTGLGVARRRVSMPRVLLAALAFPLSAGFSLVLVTLVWWVIRLLNPNLQVILVGSYGSAWYLAGLLVLGAAGMAAAFLLLCRRLGTEALAAGALLAWGVLAVLMATVFTAGSYILFWPLLASLPALAWMMATGGATRAGLRLAVTSLAVIAATLLLLPVGLVGFSALAVRLDSLMGLPVFGLPAIFVILLTGLLLPLCAWAAGPGATRGPQRQWLLPAAAAVLAALLLGVGTARSGFDAEHPRPNQMMYELDADRNQAHWLTGDARLDEWTAQFIPRTTVRNPEAGPRTSFTVPTFSAPAPLLPMPLPELVVVEQHREAGSQTWRLRLVSPRAAPLLLVEVRADGPIIAAFLAGRPLDLSSYTQAAEGSLTFAYAALPPDGIELLVRVGAPGAVVVELADWTTDLPSVPGMQIAPRPPAIMPVPAGNYEGTRVRRSFKLGS